MIVLYYTCDSCHNEESVLWRPSQYNNTYYCAKCVRDALENLEYMLEKVGERDEGE